MNEIHECLKNVRIGEVRVHRAGGSWVEVALTSSNDDADQDGVDDSIDICLGTSGVVGKENGTDRNHLCNVRNDRLQPLVDGRGR